MEADLAVVGAGGAGQSVLYHLDRALTAAGPARTPVIVVVDPVERRGDDRTWCFWDDATGSPGGPGSLGSAVHRVWDRVELVGPAGRSRILGLGDLRYLMVRSSDFYALAGAAEARLGAVRIRQEADEVSTGLVRAGEAVVRCGWVFDSRPAAPRLPATTTLLQHFRGWTVRCDRDVFDPVLPVLMDFSVPQPAQGVAFGYVLPSSGRTALVEYTEFSRSVLQPAAYVEALRGYLHRRYGLMDGDYVIDHQEDGVIPMTDAVHTRHPAPRVVRLGTAGGATRGSTGYTFAAMQRQAAAIAAAVVAGRDPVPPPAYPPRHRWLDAVMLRALDRGLTPGPDLFMRLFERNPPARVLRFLDGRTAPAEELALMASAPVGAMTRAAAGNVLARARRRIGSAG